MIQKIQADLQDDNGLQRKEYVCDCIDLPIPLAETDAPCLGGFGKPITVPFLVECECGSWCTKRVSKSAGYRVHVASSGVRVSHMLVLW